MTLSSEYKRQFGWRDWPTIFDALPSLHGQTILDLGCGVGDLAAELVARGARVIGVDMNEELLREARSRQLPNAEFRLGDLRVLPDLGTALKRPTISKRASSCQRFHRSWNQHRF